MESNSNRVRRRTKPIKDKKITILTRIMSENELGETTYIDGPLPGGENIWAYYRHISAQEENLLHTINVKVEALFIINWRNDIDETMKIKFRDEVYNISRIDDFEGYKRDLRIYAYKKEV